MKSFIFLHRRGRVSEDSLAVTLRDETQRFKAIVDTIEDGVVFVDDKQRIVLMNPAAGTLCGWGPDDAVGLDSRNVIKYVLDKGVEIPEGNDPLMEVFNTGHSVKNNNLFLLTRDNKQVSIALNISPLKDESGEVIAAVLVIRDVTKERAEEQQRADFISTASHEMRTPVAAIEGYLSLALNNKVANIDSRARDYLEKAYNSTKHLGELFQDLLTSAKAEDGRLTSHPKVVELGEFLDKLSSDLKIVANNKGLEMEFRGSTDETMNATSDSVGGERVVRPLYYTYVDSERIREVVTNLFDNAVKYTEQGKITLSITGNKQVVQCYVKDTGPGVPSEDVPHLFQKFYRVDNSATRTIGGTGLGLFICRKIIELYNGQIWVESKQGEGSTFFFNLPRLDSQKAMKLQDSEPAASPALS